MSASPKAAIGRLAARFDALTQRERGLLAAAIVVVLTLAGKGLLVDPAFARLAVEERRVAQQKKDLALAESTLQSVRMQLSADPDAALKTRLAGLAAEVAASEAQLQSLEGRLVQPERMNELLDRMLARHSGLRLLAFKSLPPVDLALPPQPAQPQGTKAASAADAAPADGGRLSGLYRHGATLTLEGGYAELHAWLAQMESAPQGLLWGDAQFSAGDFSADGRGRHRLTVTVFTLSVDKAWLAI
jgi:MSHA biogenesis protein MshJ